MKQSTHYSSSPSPSLSVSESFGALCKRSLSQPQRFSLIRNHRGKQRFGFHNLRHSLSNWMVNKGNVSPKTVQVILRHSRIQTTLDLYNTQEDRDETQAAQGAYLKAMGMTTDIVQ